MMKCPQCLLFYDLTMQDSRIKFKWGNKSKKQQQSLFKICLLSFHSEDHLEQDPCLKDGSKEAEVSQSQFLQ